jgi:hypothetical protein
MDGPIFQIIKLLKSSMYCSGKNSIFMKKSNIFTPISNPRFPVSGVSHLNAYDSFRKLWVKELICNKRITVLFLWQSLNLVKYKMKCSYFVQIEKFKE